MKKQNENTITLNKKAFHDYYMEEHLEAGIALEGWEVKSLREGRVQLRDSYVLIKEGEAFLIGILITPLPTASTHIHPEADRTRKLLLNKKEIKKLIGQIERKGYTLVACSLYWKKNRVKCDIALAKGKKTHDKREVVKEREFNRQKERLLKRG